MNSRIRILIFAGNANLQRVSVVDAASFDPNRASGASDGVPRVYSGSVLMLQFYPVPDSLLGAVR